MQIKFTTVTQEDSKRFDECGMNGEALLADHTKVIAIDEKGNRAYIFIPTKTIEMVGKEYVSSHVKMTYSEALGEWFLSFSLNDYQNDPERNPSRTVCVEFVENKAGENTEVWRNVHTGKYYLRMLCNEPFARWMTCGPKRTNWTDCNCIRPNVTFVNVTNNERETVRYDDWNDVAAYSDTFNPHFKEGK